MTKKITRFEDMPVWQEAQAFAVKLYKLTKVFPNEELYGLTSQTRHSSSSISANIAEGFGRNSQKDKAHFYHIALGSLLETKNFIYLGAKLDYIEKDKVNELIEISESIHNQINAILKYFRKNG